jgi:hypothetical protein
MSVSPKAATFEIAMATEDDKSIAESDLKGRTTAAPQSLIRSYRKDGANWRELMFP